MPSPPAPVEGEESKNTIRESSEEQEQEVPEAPSSKEEEVEVEIEEEEDDFDEEMEEEEKQDPKASQDQDPQLGSKPIQALGSKGKELQNVTGQSKEASNTRANETL